MQFKFCFGLEHQKTHFKDIRSCFLQLIVQLFIHFPSPADVLEDKLWIFSYCHSFITHKFIFKCSIWSPFPVEGGGVYSHHLESKQAEVQGERNLYAHTMTEAILEIALIHSIYIQSINPTKKIQKLLGCGGRFPEFPGQGKGKRRCIFRERGSILRCLFWLLL